MSLLMECGAGTWFSQYNSACPVMLLAAAAPLSGKSPDYTAIPSHKEFVGYTKECCSAVEDFFRCGQWKFWARWLKL
jgi:hypothetical protein